MLPIDSCLCLDRDWLVQLEQWYLCLLLAIRLNRTEHKRNPCFLSGKMRMIMMPLYTHECAHKGIIVALIKLRVCTAFARLSCFAGNLKCFR